MNSCLLHDSESSGVCSLFTVTCGDFFADLCIWEGRPNQEPPSAATATTQANGYSGFDVVYYISSDEATGEVLRQKGFNAVPGALNALCCQEAAAAGAAATARVASFDAFSVQRPSANEHVMSGAIGEAKHLLRRSAENFFAALEEALVRRSLMQQWEVRNSARAATTAAAATCWRPLRVLLVIDRNHPPNALRPRFNEVQQLLRKLQRSLMQRCGARANVAATAVLLSPDAAADGSSIYSRGSKAISGPQDLQHSRWPYPWSRDVVLRCMQRVLNRDHHATLPIDRDQQANVQAKPGLTLYEGIKALHICLSFFSCFKSYPQILQYIRTHPDVDCIIQMQSVLQEQQQQQGQAQQQQNEHWEQHRLLVSALSNIIPFSLPPSTPATYEALAASLRRCPPDGGPNETRHNGFCSPPIADTATELLRQLNSLFLDFERTAERHRQQIQQQPAEKQQQQRPCTPSRGHLCQVEGDNPASDNEASMQPPTEVTIKLPEYFSVFLGGERETLSSLSQQIISLAQEGGPWEGPPGGPSLRDICASLKPVERPHVTTFYLGRGHITVSRREVEVAKAWIDAALKGSKHDCHTVLPEPPKEPLQPNLIRLYELLASRRQKGLHAGFRVTHLLLADFGLACAALHPLKEVLPLAEQRSTKAPQQLAAGGYTVPKAVGGISEGIGVTIEGDSSCLDHGTEEGGSSCEGPLCMAAYHYAHTTLCLFQNVGAVMSNYVIEAADRAIQQGIQQGKLKAGTSRPYRTGPPCNVVGPSEGSTPSEGYEDLKCYAVAGGSDPQELLVITGAPIMGRPARLWVWCIPEDEQEELGGDLQEN